MARVAPLYFLTELPVGKEFYLDTASDAFLGFALEEGFSAIPADPGGVVEFAGYLGIWSSTRPRIYFSASPTSWESFPSDLAFDIPLKESGQIKAAAEVGSRDDRRSRLLVLGVSWGVFLEGVPGNLTTNSLGGGVGAASARCLVVNQGTAYAYNGSLWAIAGDGTVEDIGAPVLDLLPEPATTRLSVSAVLNSLFVIDESTGVALRYHFSRREWFVEDRYALSVTDIDGVDSWVSKSGYPTKGNASVYADDVEATTSVYYTVSGFDAVAKSFTLTPSGFTGLSIGQRVTVVADEDPRERAVFTISAVTSTTISVNETISLSAVYTYRVYPGVGEWGTMLDTGQLLPEGLVAYADVGITSGDRWYLSGTASDFAGDPADRSSVALDEYSPILVDDALGGGSTRVGIGNNQRVQRFIIWTPVPDAVGLSEFQLNYTPEGEM